jgi:hypothetical protein
VSNFNIVYTDRNNVLFSPWFRRTSQGHLVSNISVCARWRPEVHGRHMSHNLLYTLPRLLAAHKSSSYVSAGVSYHFLTSSKLAAYTGFLPTSLGGPCHAVFIPSLCRWMDGYLSVYVKGLNRWVSTIVLPFSPFVTAGGWRPPVRLLQVVPGVKRLLMLRTTRAAYTLLGVYER